MDIRRLQRATIAGSQRQASLINERARRLTWAGVAGAWLWALSSCGGATANVAGPPEAEGPGSGGGGGGVPGVDGDLCGNSPENGFQVISGPSGPSGADYDQVFRSLTVHPTDPQVVYLGTERNGIVKSVDGGATWTRLRLGMRHGPNGYPEVWDMAISPTDPNLVIAATLDSPGPVTGEHPSSIGGVYRSVDGGETWSRSNCGLSSSRAVSVLFHPTAPSVVILGVEGGAASFQSLLGEYFPGGLMRSTDAGVNWDMAAAPSGSGTNGYWILQATDGPSAEVVSFGFDYTNTSGNLGFLRTDGGAEWTGFAPGLREGLFTSWDISADGQVLYGNRRDSFEIVRSRDGGITWDTVSVPANGLIRVHPESADVMFFEANGRLFRTEDGLVTYATVLHASNRINDVEFSPADPEVVYAATEGYHIYRSEDGGLSFNLVASLRESVFQ